MSYCVNCGVELESRAKRCPLCATPVINPNMPADETAAGAYSDKVVLPKSVTRRYRAMIATMVILIPNIVCLLANILFNKGSAWSFYLGASCGLLWVLFVLPFFAKKPNPYALWAVDSVAVCAYTYFFFAMDAEYMWFLKCALPPIAAVSFFALIYIIWYRRKKRGRTLCTIHLFADMIICSVIIGAEISLYYSNFLPLYVSLIVAASLFAILIFLFYLNSSKRMKAWLSRNFFVE